MAPTGNTPETLTLHEAPSGAILERRTEDGTVQTVMVVPYFSNVFSTGTTYRPYGSGQVLVLEENADAAIRPEAAGDWTIIQTP